MTVLTQYLKTPLVADEAITAGLVLKLGTGLAIDDGEGSNPAQAAIKPIGVSQEDVAAGDYCQQVAVSGPARVIAGATIAVGDKLAADTDGKVRPITGYTLTDGTLYYTVGTALEAASTGSGFNANLGVQIFDARTP